MKVFGIGLNKTGTRSLKICMRSWGMRHITYNLDAFNAYRNADWQYLKELTETHDSFENWPWALMYEKLYQWYPDAYFILSTRKDPKTWFRSLSNHAKRMGPLVDYELYIYGYANPLDDMQAHIDYYNKHNAAVREFFADKPGQLLEVCWENGDGWDQLAQFLNLQVPNIEFPHANKSLNFYKRMEKNYRPVLGKYKQKIFGKKNQD